MRAEAPPSPLEILTGQVRDLRQAVETLSAESGARRVLGRYMRLCDVPMLMAGASEPERCRAIAALFTEDGVWEGVGGAHGAQFGRHVGREQIAAHFEAFYARREPRQIFNTHYLCTEQLSATLDGAEGWWVQFQPWVDAAGAALLRSSRLHVTFRKVKDAWLIARYRTENLFIAQLPTPWWDRLIDEPHLHDLGDRQDHPPEQRRPIPEIGARTS